MDATTLKSLYQKLKPLKDGQVAAYIPELAKVDPELFGIAVVKVDASHEVIGDVDAEFTLQSVSKPFVYGLALEDLGRETVRSHVGVEPTGNAFNSILELERNGHRPYVPFSNPMINSGAIAISSLVRGGSLPDKEQRVRERFEAYAGRALTIDETVRNSEKTTAHRNRAIAHLLCHVGVIPDRAGGAGIDEALDLYFGQCSIRVNALDLATMAATLANGGVNPRTGVRAISESYLRDLLSLMFTCGMYDSSGEWAYSVGLPSKSGVSGGILAVVPGKMGIGVFSPRLDSHGHSVRGVQVLKALSQEWGLSIFNSSAWERVYE